jgi:long-chain acyl-CoA synthetase
MKELIFHRTFLPAIEQHADKVGFHDGDHHGTFAEHGERVLRLTDAMRRQLGLRREDRFAILGVNGHEFLELYHAAFLGAGVVNPLNLRLSPKELQFILADSGVRVIFVDRFFADHLHRAIFDVRRDLPLEKVVLIGDAEVPHDVGYEDLIASGDPVVPAEPEEDDPVVLMYTGGTTGVPKGALLDNRAELLNIYHVGIALSFAEERVYLHQTPMFHAASMAGVLGIPATGATSVFIPLFDPPAVIDVIERYEVDWTLAVPTMLAMILDHPAFSTARLRSLRDLVYGASPMPAALLERVQRELPDASLWQGYGMTECSSVLTFLTKEDHERGGPILRSAGRPVFGVNLSIRDRQGNALPRGQTGEACARGGNFMREYWHRPELTADAFRDGWYHTGDEGYLDEDGYLYLVDRVKDMIVSGGENIYSIEVENAISTHPDVHQVAVIGIPHDVWGEQVHAVIVPRPGATPTLEDIQTHARRALAGYKVPRSIELRTEPLPLSGALKPLKRELRRPHWEHRSVDAR